MGLYKECNIVGTVTRFHEGKGNEFLLKAARIVLKALPNTYFVLVGDGPLMKKLKEDTRELGIQHNVIFTGYQEDVVGLMSIFDVNVMIGTVNHGSPVIGSGLVANTKGAIIGNLTTGIEMGRIEEALGFL